VLMESLFSKGIGESMADFTDEHAALMLSVHDALWDYLLEKPEANNQLIFAGNPYEIMVPPGKNYASVILPNANGRKYLWITQNLHKNTYGTMAILRAKANGFDHRITWIIDTNDGQFRYRTNIMTMRDPSGKMTDGTIEIYDSLGTDKVWSHNKNMLRRKAAF